MFLCFARRESEIEMEIERADIQEREILTSSSQQEVLPNSALRILRKIAIRGQAVKRLNFGVNFLFSFLLISSEGVNFRRLEEPIAGRFAA